MASHRKKHNIVDLEDGINSNSILLDALLTKIMQNFPITEWSKLERVSKQFQRCVHNAYRALRAVNLKTVFLPEFGKYLKEDPGDYNKYGEKLVRRFLEKLIHRCPLLQAISGFDCLNRISSCHLVLLSEFAELKNVTFENVTVDVDKLSRFLKKFPGMKSLKFVCDRRGPIFSNDNDNDNDFDFDFFISFYGLTELTMADIIMCSGSFLSTVNAENLKMLNFTGSNFQATYVGALLRRCNNLEILQLTDPGACLHCSSVGFELEALQCLPNLKKLWKFELSGNHDCMPFSETEPSIMYDSNALLNILVKCQSLREIRLRCGFYIEIVNDNFLRGIIAECPHLEALDLDLDHCNSEEIVSNIEYLGNLTHLALYCENNNNSILLNALCSKLHKLNNLSLLELWGVKEADLALLNNVKNLTNFTYSGRITNGILKNWIENGFLSKLTVLNIFERNFADEFMKTICENTPNLKSFYVSDGNITDETLLALAECCKYIETLDFRHCLGFSENGLLKFLSICPSLRLTNTNFYREVFLSNVLFQPFKHILRCDQW